MQKASQLRFSSASNRLAACSGRRRAVLVRIAEAEAPAAAPPPPPPPAAPHRAVLLKKFKAHDASVTALSVLDDAAGVKRVLTTSLDKTLCTWSLEGGEQDAGIKLLCTKVEVAGGPVFSLHPGFKPKIKDPNTKQSRPVVYCGLAAKEIAAWQPDALKFSEQVRMNGHTGWVRSMSSSGKYLFSCGCNYLRQWDQAYAVPKEVSSTKLFTGDILAIAANDKRVFTAGADGSLRSWTIGKGSGELAEAAVREKAHDGRITGLVVCGSLLYSAGYDGTIKAWDAASLKLVMEVKAAHNGERVQALVLAPGLPVNSTSSSSSSSASSSSSSSTVPTATTSSPTSASPSAAAAAGTSNGTSNSTTSSSGDSSNSTSSESHSLELDCHEIVSCEGDMLAAATATDAITEEPENGSAPASPSASAQSSPSSSGCSSPVSSSPSSLKLLYSGGDDGLVRCWDARLMTPVGEPLQVHSAAVKALAVGDSEVLVSGDANGEVAVWCV